MAHGKPVSLEQINRIKLLAIEGLPQLTIAERLGLTHATISARIKRLIKEGELDSKYGSGYRPRNSRRKMVGKK